MAVEYYVFIFFPFLSLLSCVCTYIIHSIRARILFLSFQWFSGEEIKEGYLKSFTMFYLTLVTEDYSICGLSFKRLNRVLGEGMGVLFLKEEVLWG